MVGLLSPGADRLAEANIERHEAAADMRIGAVEDALARFVAIEAEREEAADHPARLRGAFDDREIVGAVDRIRGAGIVLLRVAQESADIARRREAEAPTVGSLAR